ncbi:MAG TPA: VOC family protein [Actinopolymorphaceae bacterium]|jgi:hypothetical protein
MAERTEFPDGAPCWVDLRVPDLDEARRFYSGVFGWSFVEPGREAGRYVMCLTNGVPVAALTAGRQVLETGPPLWTTYLATRDVDLAARIAGQHGGKVVTNPTDLGSLARTASIVDPTGAAVGFWQGRRHLGFGLWDEPGAVGWSELVTPDGGTADGFYQVVFGYDEQRQIGGGDYDYSVWKTGGQRVCGRWQTTELAPQWVTFFTVEDTAAALKRVSQLGGRIEREPWDTPYGRMASLADPFGVPFSVIGPIDDRSPSA